MKKAAKKAPAFVRKNAPSGKFVFKKKAAKKVAAAPSLPQEKEDAVEIKAAIETLQGNYANMAQIRSRKEEVIIDFCTREGSQGVLTSRIIVSPGTARKLLEALQKNLEIWDEHFGDEARNE